MTCLCRTERHDPINKLARVSPGPFQQRRASRQSNPLPPATRRRSLARCCHATGTQATRLCGLCGSTTYTPCLPPVQLHKQLGRKSIGKSKPAETSAPLRPQVIYLPIDLVLQLIVWPGLCMRQRKKILDIASTGKSKRGQPTSTT